MASNVKAVIMTELLVVSRMIAMLISRQNKLRQIKSSIVIRCGLCLLAILFTRIVLADDHPAQDQTWPFQYRENDFRDAAMLDLRHLNEQSAGEHGFIRLNADGNGFVRGDGAPIRFWGIISNNFNHYSQEQLSEHARWLAKMGVNMVRRQVLLPSTRPASLPEDVNQPSIDETWRYVAATKQQGIYTAVINYAALGTYDKVDLSRWGIAGYEVNYVKDAKAAKPWGLMFFNPQMQKAYKAWLKQLYGQVNPYTGITLAQDPAVLMIQLVTEDSLLFYTLNGIKPEQMRELGRQYGDWLKIKYGSLDKALEAWDQEATTQKDGGSNDDVASGVMGFYHIWRATSMAPLPSPGRAKRLSDQVEFLSRTMQKFYAEIARYLREDLGCKQLILCDNWRPADPMTMQDAERWCYLPGQVMAENHFFTGIGGDTWHTVAGDVRSNPTAVKPLNLNDPASFVFKQVAGHATFITSTGWVFPNIHQSEAPFLLAAYGGLDGLGGICWDGFSVQPEYDLKAILQINDQTKWFMTWDTARPPFVSSFPAAALMYRNGCITPAAPVVQEERKLQDIWDRKLPLAMDHGSYKATTDAMKSGSVDPLAFFVGPVCVKYDGDPAKNKVADLSKYILRDQQRVLSNTGQVELNYGKGICTIDAPKAQGVCGFLDQTKDFSLSTVSITSTNPYAAILAVALDDQPLASSQKVLVQVGATARPTGWKSEPVEVKEPGQTEPVQAERILDIGTAPWQVTATHATVTVANPHLTKATLLDSNGMAVRDVPVTHVDDKCRVELPAETMYLVLTGQ